MLALMALASGLCSLIGGILALRGHWPASALFFAISANGWAAAFMTGRP